MEARSPWTHDELAILIPKIKKTIESAELADENVRPLPPMSVNECKDLFFKLLDIAKTRPLASSETFLCGQILSNLQMAVRAETLGRKGRFFVLSDDDIKSLTKGKM